MDKEEFLDALRNPTRALIHNLTKQFLSMLEDVNVSSIARIGKLHIISITASTAKLTTKTTDSFYECFGYLSNEYNIHHSTNILSFNKYEIRYYVSE